MSSVSSPAVPALQNGDHLTRREFERRYQAMPNVEKAELIEGTVYMPSPVHYTSHSKPHSAIVGWLVTYAAATPHVSVGDNATVRLDLDNEPQPDALLRIDEVAGGRSLVSDDDYIEGPPEFIAEITHSSAAYDLHDKKQAYRRNGVQEYLVWQIEEARIDWFVLEEGEFLPLTPGEDGSLESRAYPGLVLDVEALLDGDVSAVLERVQERLGTDTHRSFVQRLEANG